MQLTLPDGFGSSGARVVRQYFSASGKECLVAEAADATLPRVFCKDPSGEVNMFSPPDQIVSN